MVMHGTLLAGSTDDLRGFRVQGLGYTIVKGTLQGTPHRDSKNIVGIE